MCFSKRKKNGVPNGILLTINPIGFLVQILLKFEGSPYSSHHILDQSMHLWVTYINSTPIYKCICINRIIQNPWKHDIQVYYQS